MLSATTDPWSHSSDANHHAVLRWVLLALLAPIVSMGIVGATDLTVER